MKGLDGQRLTAGDLRECLAHVPDDTPVVVVVPRHHAQPGGFWEIALTINYAGQSQPTFVFEPTAFVLGTGGRAPDVDEVV